MPYSTGPMAFRSRLLVLLFSVLLLAALSGRCFAFTTPPTVTQLEKTDTSMRRPMSSFFDDVGKFFEQMGGNDNASNKNERNDRKSDDELVNVDDDDDDEYAGSTRLVAIPAKSIKPGGLRLLLMFYLMGMQNSPEQGAWKADQPTTDEYVVDMYYHDRTAALTVKLTQHEITIDRIGSTPSNAYLMQESIIIDGILDELQVCVTQVGIKDEDRLLLLPEPRDAIEKARESLAFS